MRLPAFLIFALCICTSVAAQPTEPQLEFLAGNWSLYDPSGARVGRSVVVVQAPNAMLYEQRFVGDAPMQPLWFANSERNHRWTQLFVGALGLVREFPVVSTPGLWPVVMGADVTLRDGTPVRFRMTMSKVSNDESRRVLEVSRDSGETWSTVFDYTYRRETSG